MRAGSGLVNSSSYASFPVATRLDRMEVELFCRLGQRLVYRQRSNRDLRLERRRMIPLGLSHFCSPFAGVSGTHQSRFFTYRPVLFCWTTSDNSWGGLALVSQHRLEVGKWRVGRRRSITVGARAVACRFQLPLMLVVVAVEAQQFPVAAVGRVVAMVVVAVMHGEFAQVGAHEFAGAAAADPGIDFQGLLAIALFAGFSVAACIGDDTVELARVAGFHAAYFS